MGPMIDGNQIDNLPQLEDALRNEQRKRQAACSKVDNIQSSQSSLGLQRDEISQYDDEYDER